MPLEAWFTKRFRNKSQSLFTTDLKSPIKMGDKLFWRIGSHQDIFGGENDYAKDFQEVPELNAILNIRARAMSMGKIKVVSKATGEEAKNNQSLIRTLKSPNWFQSQDEFIRQSSLFRDVYGNEYLFFLTPVGMPNSFNGLFTLNPKNVDVKYNGGELYFLEPKGNQIEYLYVLQNKKVPIEAKNIIHLNDNRIDNGNILKGVSKLKALQPNIKNIRAAYKKRNIILNMPIGVMSNNNNNDAIGQKFAMDDKEKEQAMNDLRENGALPILTNMALNYDSMAIDANQMGLFEEVEQDVIRICDSYGVPYELLGSLKGNRFASNQNTAEKWFYENTIIPDMEERIGAINQYLETENKPFEVAVDYSHLPVFSEDAKNRAASLSMLVTALDKAFTSGIITVEQYQYELSKMGVE